jgi:hypothetical protein
MKYDLVDLAIMVLEPYTHSFWKSGLVDSEILIIILKKYFIQILNTHQFCIYHLKTKTKQVRLDLI